MTDNPLPTRGQAEAQISEAVTHFEKEHMGRGPLETKTWIIEDMIIVRLKGVLTRAELQLLKSETNARGRDLTKQVRIELIENGRSILDETIRTITGRKVKSLHTDVSTVTGERIIIFVVDGAPEFE